MPLLSNLFAEPIRSRSKPPLRLPPLLLLSRLFRGLASLSLSLTLGFVFEIDASLESRRDYWRKELMRIYVYRLAKRAREERRMEFGRKGRVILFRGPTQL